MKWWHPENFEKQRPYWEARMRIVKALRLFFEDRGFWDVETPILQTMPGADVHIHGYRVENGQYLQNSPEFAMKKLLVAGCPKIYQICKVFRKEERTKLHNPEFTMLEWYRADADYNDIMKDCEELLRSLNVTEFHCNGKSCDPHKDWQYVSVNDAFKTMAGISLEDHLTPLSPLRKQGSFDADIGNSGLCRNDALLGFAAAACAQGIRTTPTDNWDDIFHAVMAEKIEPHLGQGAPTILYDYPVSMASLSRKKPSDPRFAERFELYVCGVELANAFSELTDAKEQRERFEEDMDLKEKLYGERYPMDEDFLNALEHGLPESGGIALGVDRLVMLATGAENIEDVLWTAKS